MMDDDLFLLERDGDGEDISENCGGAKNVSASGLIFY